MEKDMLLTCTSLEKCMKLPCNNLDNDKTHYVDDLPTYIKLHRKNIIKKPTKRNCFVRYSYFLTLNASLLYNSKFPFVPPSIYRNKKLFSKYANILKKEKYSLQLNFKHWGLIGRHDLTLAHLAAWYNKLPKGFPEAYPELFITPDQFGNTPAHDYVQFNKLPLSFQHWGVCNTNNISIAYVAAKFLNLPDGFEEKYPELLNIETVEGITLLEVINDDMFYCGYIYDTRKNND